MRLYHFIDQRYGIDNSEKRRLKLSRIKDLNDPFELLSMDLSENGHKEEFEALKLKISEDLGILCFSQCWRNPVQWSHYAENHKGVCLGFEMKQEDAFKVEYIEKRYNKEFTKKLLEGDLDSGSLEINNWIKSKLSLEIRTRV